METETSKSTISAAELNQSLTESPQQIFIIDLMNTEMFTRGHIPGAVNIPVEELQNRISEIPADKNVVVVCARGLMKSERGLQQLQKAGFRNAKKLTGGTSAWFDLKSNS